MVWSAFCLGSFMRSLLLLIVLLFCLGARAQKRTLEVLDAADIKSLIISSDEIFKIHLTTIPGNEIRIHTMTDGEYYNDISLDSEVQGEVLLLSSRYREILQSGFDKLSAHKVLSMEIEVEIPQNMRVEILSNVASLFGSGTYDRLFVQLKSGSCYLKDFEGDAVINTYEGNVDIETVNARVQASSRHGAVEVGEPGYGANKVTVTSINGNIRVNKTK